MTERAHSVLLKTVPQPVFKPAFRAVNGGFLQKKETTPYKNSQEDEERKKKRQILQCSPTSSGLSSANRGQIPAIVHDVLTSPGQPLDPATSAFMEPRFGHDFSQVRVHTDAKAAESARTVNALAYTVGQDLVFGVGQYKPGTNAGYQLLAHELVHTIQQHNDTDEIPEQLEITNITHTTEKEAHTAADAIMKSQFFAFSSRKTKQLARQEDAGGQFNGGAQQLAPTPQTPPVSSPVLVIDQPTASQRFNINATPTMPTLNCQARITGLTPDPTPNTDFNWEIQVREAVAPDGCPSSRVGNCSSTISPISVRGGGWKPQFNNIQGGQAVITAAANVGGTTLSSSVTVDIRGTNPGSASITAQCGGAGTDADRVACHESGRRQFDGSGNPLLGPGGDVGIMQLCNPAATCLQRWNWNSNVGQGMTLLGQKRTGATAYLDTHLVDGNYPNSLNLGNVDALQRETLQRYNGGRYWGWNSSRNLWEPDPPNNYVANLLAHC